MGQICSFCSDPSKQKPGHQNLLQAPPQRRQDSSSDQSLEGKQGVVITGFPIEHGDEMVGSGVSKRDRVLERIRAGDESCFRDASAEMTDDFEVVLAYVKMGGSLSHASTRLQDDKDIVHAAVNRNGYNLVYASLRLRDDADIIMAAIDQRGRALMCASTRLQDDEEIVMAAVSQRGLDLIHASQRLRGNRAIVMAAINQDGSALPYASLDLRSEQDVVLAAGSFAGVGFQYAGRNLQNNRDFIARAIHAGRNDPSFNVEWNVLSFVSNDIRHLLRQTALRFNTFGQVRAFLQIHAEFMEFLLCVKSESTPEDNPVKLVNFGDRPTFVELHRHIA